MAKDIISLQIKAHEVYIKPLKPRESILEIKESDDEDEDQDEDEDNVFDDLDDLEDLKFLLFNTNYCIKN